jgi:hypothetical protein
VEILPETAAVSGQDIDFGSIFPEASADESGDTVEGALNDGRDTNIMSSYYARGSLYTAGSGGSQIANASGKGSVDCYAYFYFRMTADSRDAFRRILNAGGTIKYSLSYNASGSKGSWCGMGYASTTPINHNNSGTYSGTGHTYYFIYYSGGHNESYGSCNKPQSCSCSSSVYNCAVKLGFTSCGYYSTVKWTYSTASWSAGKSVTAYLSGDTVYAYRMTMTYYTSSSRVTATASTGNTISSATCTQTTYGDTSVYVLNYANNTTNASRSAAQLMVDSGAPVITGISIYKSGTYNKESALAITVNFNDTASTGGARGASSGVAAIYIRNTTTNYTPVNYGGASGSSYRINIAGSQINGYWQFRVRDKANNYSGWYYAGYYWWDGEAPKLSGFSVTQQTSGTVAGVNIPIASSGNWSNAPNKVSFNVTDGTGSVAKDASYGLKAALVDYVTVSFTCNGLTYSLSSRNSGQISSSGSTASKSFSFYLPYSASILTNITFRAYDRLSNSAASNCIFHVLPYRYP